MILKKKKLYTSNKLSFVLTACVTIKGAAHVHKTLLIILGLFPQSRPIKKKKKALSEPQTITPLKFCASRLDLTKKKKTHTP